MWAAQRLALFVLASLFAALALFALSGSTLTSSKFSDGIGKIHNVGGSYIKRMTMQGTSQGDCATVRSWAKVALSDDPSVDGALSFSLHSQILRSV